MTALIVSLLRDCLQASPVFGDSLILPPQMGYQNMTIPQLKVDKELSSEARGQAQTHTYQGQITKEVRAYTGGISYGTDTEVWWQRVVVVVVVVVEAGQRLDRAPGRLRSDRLSGGWVVSQSLKRATHLDKLPSPGIKHN